MKCDMTCPAAPTDFASSFADYGANNEGTEVLAYLKSDRLKVVFDSDK